MSNRFAVIPAISECGSTGEFAVGPNQNASRASRLARSGLAILLIVIATGASYAPSVRNGFVWDDTALVLRDPLIRSWRLIPEGFNHYLFVDATPSNFYRPIQRLTYTLEYAAFTARPGPYHFTNIALHILAAIALLFFADALLRVFGCNPERSRWIALIATLVWAIHPVHTAAVVYVSGRADPLAAMFGFTGCFLVLHSLVRSNRTGAICLVGAAVAFLSSALSKETGLLFPVFMIVILLVLRKWRSLSWLGVVVASVAIIYLSLRLPAEHDPVPRLGPETPICVRPITMARAVAEYAGLLLLPVNLHMDRDVRISYSSDVYSNTSAAAARELQTLLGIAIVVGLITTAVKMHRRDRLIFVLLLLVGVAYLPVSGVFRLNASVAEHWIYVPSAFLFLAAGVASAKLMAERPRIRFALPISTAVFAMWMLFLGGRTLLRTFDWKDQRTFLERTIAAGGNSARMLINLAALESSENKLDAAKADLEQALQKEPDQPFALLELATVEIKRYDFASARTLLGKITASSLVGGQAHELLAVLDNKQKGQANLLRMRLATRTGFCSWATEKRYIKLLAETGATSGAIQELQTCLRSEWYRAETWQLLAQLLARTGQTRAAAKAFALANSYDVHLSARPAVL